MRKDIYSILATQVRVRRKRAGLSIEKLAEIAGVGAGFLAHVETNQKKPSLETVGKIAHALQIPVADLFKQHPAPEPDADLRLAFQLTALLKEKKPARRAAVVKAFRTLAKSL